MIGERMGTPQAREISAVCTHPDFLGRGYARTIDGIPHQRFAGQRLQPFLHVSHENVRAKSLYERQGFRVRRNIGFWSLTAAH
jgi:predicted GNAT family acetyltransferase